MPKPSQTLPRVIYPATYTPPGTVGHPRPSSLKAQAQRGLGYQGKRYNGNNCASNLAPLFIRGPVTEATKTMSGHTKAWRWDGMGEHVQVLLGDPQALTATSLVLGASVPIPPALASLDQVPFLCCYPQNATGWRRMT
ncbi:hypothetical protein MHYP_G00128040 [Metynnis hypsauchen]